MATDAYGHQVPVVYTGSDYTTSVDSYGNVTQKPVSTQGQSGSGYQQDQYSSTGSNNSSSSNSSSKPTITTPYWPTKPTEPTIPEAPKQNEISNPFDSETMTQILDMIGGTSDGSDSITASYIRPSGNITYMGY